MDECPICFDACEHDAVTAECCKKVYHRECLNKCPTCPTCRFPNQTFTIVIEGDETTRVALTASGVEEAHDIDYFLRRNILNGSDQRHGVDPRHEVRVVFPRMNCRLISACFLAFIGVLIVFGMCGAMAFALVYKQGGPGSYAPPPFSNNTLV
jgi:hypothetical protein